MPLTTQDTLYESLGLDCEDDALRIAAQLDQWLKVPGLSSGRQAELVVARVILGDPVVRAEYDRLVAGARTGGTTGEQVRCLMVSSKTGRMPSSGGLSETVRHRRIGAAMVGAAAVMLTVVWVGARAPARGKFPTDIERHT